MVASLMTFGVAAWPPPGPMPSSFQFHHQGSNFAIFVILFALCMMEVVVLKIITEDSNRDQSSTKECKPVQDEICFQCGGDKLGEEEDSDVSSSGDNRDLHNVREFLEAISTKLAGGPLEGTRVSALYDHPA
ncbi:unnamed protein product, partial [Leptidea sinapis]